MTNGKLTNGVQLGQQQIPIRKVTVYPAHAIDIKEGSPIGAPFTHHIQVILMSENEGIALPVDARFLRSLRAQIDRVIDDHVKPISSVKDYQ